MRVVVIGGDAAGMSAASQLKRRIKTADVIVLEKTRDVSYGACGMPYNIGYKRDINDLVVITAEEFKTKRGIDVRLLNEVVGLDEKQNKVLVKDLSSGREYELEYDYLVIATGASSVKPPVRGIKRDGVFTLKTLEDARRIKTYIEREKPRKAVLIGGGFINLELAENFKRLGMDVVILEKLNGILLGFEDEIREVVYKELENNGVKLILGVDVESIEDGLTVETSKGEFGAEIVNVAAGIKPNTDFLRDSSVKLVNGAIDVDRYFKTSVGNIYAGGDCALIYHRILNRNVYMPLGTNANKAGRLIGANITGASKKFGGIVGTSVFKVFNAGIARTGLSMKEAQKEGYDAFKAVITAPVTAHGFPVQGRIKVALIAERKTGKLLGGQIAGDFTGVWRIDVIATALYSNLTIDDIQNLDLAYTPPLAPVWDPILVCANQAAKRV